jgi:hypothetical protein
MQRELACGVIAAALALVAGCGPNDNSKIQTPNDQPIGAPSKGGVQGQPGSEPPQKQVPGRPGGKVS